MSYFGVATRKLCGIIRTLLEDTLHEASCKIRCSNFDVGFTLRRRVNATPADSVLRSTTPYRHASDATNTLASSQGTK
jgi:hypothetical protein